MNLGLIGLPQVGKKTIFGLLTGIAAEKAPTRDGIGYAMASVRDSRVDHLSAMYNPKKTKYAEIDEKTQAKLAEIQIMMESRMAEARATGDPAKVQQIEDERLADIERAKSRAESEKDEVRNA